MNDTTVVHMYKETFEGTCKEEPTNPNWASTVWTNKGGKWVGISSRIRIYRHPPQRNS